MLWQDIAQQLAPIAPTLGRMLGSALPIPFGGALGEVAGKVIADALGVEATPEAVSVAIQATPADVVKAQLEDAESEARARYAAIAAQAKAEAIVGAKQVETVAATMQAELVNGAWYQRMWRPAAMFMWVATWPVQIGTILYPVWFDNQTALGALPTLIYALSTWNAAPAALAGVYSWNRTMEKLGAANSNNLPGK